MRADARIHARVINDVGAAVSKSRPKDMEEVQQLVSQCNSQLSVLKADKEAVFLHFPSFPRVSERIAESLYDCQACDFYLLDPCPYLAAELIISVSFLRVSSSCS